MKILCKMLGGSHSYGLNTPASDTDYRGVFINTDVATLVGLHRHDHQQKQNSEVDEVYTEFRHSLNLLRQANTQTVELLYNDNWLETSPEWQLVQKHRAELLDSERLFSCLRGYMQGELKLANGERQGKLGGKRKASIDQYGFSPKNFVQLFRLAWAGSTYFKYGFFPVNVAEHDDVLHKFLMEVKTKPENFSKEALNKEAAQWESTLENAFQLRKFSTKFNDELAHNLCLQVYGPLIQEAYQQKFKS